MLRINTAADVRTTGQLVIDAGEDVRAVIPATPPPLEYDSGERDMRGVLSNDATASIFTVQRVGRVVTMAIEGLSAPGSTSVVIIGTSHLPAGFRPTSMRWGVLIASDASTNRMRVTSSGTTSLFRSQAGGAYAGTITYLVPPELPTTLPGDPA